MNTIDPVVPAFSVRERHGVCYVVARWPADGEELIKACPSRIEGELWIKTQSKGWLRGRKAPI